MRIGIVGAGHMGKALGRLWVAAGHSVSFSYSRNLPSLMAWAGPLGPEAVVTSPRIAAADAEVVLLSVPLEALDDAVAAMGDGHATKPLITTVSPYAADFTGNAVNMMSRIGDLSAAEEIARRAPSFKVVEAFNLIFADLLASGQRPFDRMTVPLCGDDPGAKRTVSGLIRDAGLDPVDVGGLRVARALEPMATAWVQLAAAAGIFPLASLTLQHVASRPTLLQSSNPGALTT